MNRHLLTAPLLALKVEKDEFEKSENSQRFKHMAGDSINPTASSFLPNCKTLTITKIRWNIEQIGN